VIVTPTKLDWMNPPEVGDDARFAWWKRLRDVPSSWVGSRGEAERFLYYDGPTLAPTPVDAKLAGNELTITLALPEETYGNPFPYRQDVPRRAILIRHRAGQLSGQTIDLAALHRPQTSTVTQSLGQDNLHGDEVISKFRQLLTLTQTITAFGEIAFETELTEAEANGLIDAWRNQFFQTDGTRLLTFLWRQEYDAMCPIQIRPSPTELARVGIILTEFGG
jgi:hypothetical protein